MLWYIILLYEMRNIGILGRIGLILSGIVTIRILLGEMESDFISHEKQKICLFDVLLIGTSLIFLAKSWSQN